MPLIPKQPIVAGTTYDKYWLENCNIVASSVNGEAKAIITLKPYNSQTGEISPPEYWKILSIDNILEQIQNGNTYLYQAYSSILAVVQAEIDKE